MASLHVPLSDDQLALEPLAEAHREGLRAACGEDPDIWAVYPTSWDVDHFDGAFDALLAHPARLPFAILSEGAVIGMTAYIAPDATRGVVEIGNSFIAPRMRGTGFNRRLKQLMIGHAFACGFRRIEFRVDTRNMRSMAAVEKIGGIREGVLRQERITWTGYLRDTALFAILADEWRNNAGLSTGS